MQKIQPEFVEMLMSHMGKIPLEIVLASFLFQLVGTYVDFKSDTLVNAIVKRLNSAHQNLQVCFSRGFACHFDRHSVAICYFTSPFHVDANQKGVAPSCPSLHTHLTIHNIVPFMPFFFFFFFFCNSRYMLLVVLSTS
jgi:hypothetical protein